MKKIIAIVGEKGSGKDTFAMALQEFCVKRYSFARVTSSGILAETLTLWNLPNSRENLQGLVISMDNRFGTGTLTKAIEHRILSEESDIIVFDSVRWQSDVDMIKKFPSHVLVYINADIKKRYERTKTRKEKDGEDGASFETFLKQEQVSTELEISRIGKMADYQIENSGSLKEFQDQIAEFCRKHLARL